MTVIHNADGINPYAAELAGLLARHDRRVTLVTPVNADQRPPAGVECRAVLPANFGSDGRLRQTLRLLRGLGTTLWLAVVGRRVVLAAFRRFAVEDLALAALAATGHPVVVVDHNPVPRHTEGRLSRFARRTLLARATRVVVHAPRLLAAVEPRTRGRVRVCPHPPYLATVGERPTASGHDDPVTDGQAPGGDDPVADGHAPSHGPVTNGHAFDRDHANGRRWVAFVGALRWDKGSELLADIFERIPAPVCARLGLVVCGHGSLPPDHWRRLTATGIALRDLSSPTPVPHDMLLDVLATCPLVIAPYVAATQSGTVILALSAGCRVVAFDEGGIPDVLADEGLVPTGDLAALADAIAADRGGTARRDPATWAHETAAAWAHVVEEAARGAARHPAGRARRGDRRRYRLRRQRSTTVPVQHVDGGGQTVGSRDVDGRTPAGMLDASAAGADTAGADTKSARAKRGHA